MSEEDAIADRSAGNQRARRKNATVVIENNGTRETEEAVDRVANEEFRSVTAHVASTQ
jgi:hypothetical protein